MSLLQELWLDIFSLWKRTHKKCVSYSIISFYKKHSNLPFLTIAGINEDIQRPVTRESSVWVIKWPPGGRAPGLDRLLPSPSTFMMRMIRSYHPDKEDMRSWLISSLRTRRIRKNNVILLIWIIPNPDIEGSQIFFGSVISSIPNWMCLLDKWQLYYFFMHSNFWNTIPTWWQLKQLLSPSLLRPLP